MHDVPKVDEPFVVERFTEVGDVPKRRRPKGFESTSIGTKKRVKAGTLKDLETTAQKRAPTRRRRKVTQETQQFDLPTRKRLGIETPTKDIQDRARQQLQSGSTDPAFPNRVLGADEVGVADHIVSVDFIRTRPGFARLSRENQAKVLNRPDNFVAMSPTANSSKGGKSFREWKEHKTLGPVDENFRREMIRREEDLLPKIDKQIDDLLREQLTKRNQFGND